MDIFDEAMKEPSMKRTVDFSSIPLDIKFHDHIENYRLMQVTMNAGTKGNDYSR